jgi:NAD(P)-dependent dehydrogenase (short-subunit alcohol dehydrogenase family)
MDLGLKGKVAVVSGGARGSGLEIGQRLAREGAKIVLTGRDPATVRAAEQSIRDLGGEAIGVVVDPITKDGPATIKAAAAKAFGRVAIMIINFADLSTLERDFLKISDEEFYSSVETYYMAPVRMCREFLPDMVDLNWGRVILLGSANMKNPSAVDPLIAQTVRVGGAALLKNLTFEYGKYNISFNTLAIGAFLTQLGKDYLKTAPQGAYEAYADLVPLKRWAQPSELAALVAFLCGEESVYVNGEVIRIDGGQTRSLF